MAIGALPGVQIGQAFQSRRELYDAHVHKHFRQGLSDLDLEGRSRSSFRGAILTTKTTARLSFTRVMGARPRIRSPSRRSDVHEPKSGLGDKFAGGTSGPGRARLRSSQSVLAYVWIRLRRFVSYYWTAPVGPTPEPRTFVRWAGLTMDPTISLTCCVFVPTIMFSSAIQPSGLDTLWT